MFEQQPGVTFRNGNGTGRHHIVAAVGPRTSTAVVRAAVQLARRMKRPLSLMSVVEPQPAFIVDTDRLQLNPWRYEAMREQRLAELEAQLSALPAADVLPKGTAVSVFVGHPPSTIAHLARATDAALIVMGIGPHAIRQRIFSGETTLTTARHAPCPVLAVHDDAVRTPTNVVVAVDFSVESVHAAREAIALLGDDAHIHLVHVWKRITTPVPVDALVAADADYERELPSRFARLRAILESNGPLNITTHVREGDAAGGVLATATAVHADTIVVGTRGLGAVERLFAGSVSTAVLRSSRCSVLLVTGPNVVTRGEITRMMTGSSVEAEPEHWAVELESFARRNGTRRAVLEIDDHALGAQRQLSGYTLSGATYDTHDHRVALMFESSGPSHAHATHTVSHVQSISIAGANNHDEVLCIESDDGRAILTFLDP